MAALLIVQFSLFVRPSPPGGLQAQGPGPLEQQFDRVGQLGGSAAAMVIQGERLYLVSGSSILVYSIADPLAPRLVGRSRPLADVIVDLDVDGTLALATQGQAGPAVLGLENPDQPVLRAQIPQIPQVSQLKLAGHFAYLARGEAGLSVVDLSQPERPRLRATLSDVRAVDVDLDGAIAYVAAGAEGLVKLDLSIPHSPRVIGRSRDYVPSHSVQVVDGSLYVATDGALFQLDWRKPGDPVQRGVALNLDFGPASTVLLGELLAVADHRGLHLFRPPEDPAHDLSMRLVAEQLEARAYHIREPLVSAAGRLYVSSPPTALRVIEASAEGGLRVVAQQPLIGIVNQLEVTGADAIVSESASYPGPRTVDLRVPELPRLTGVFTLTKRMLDAVIHRGVGYVSSADGKLTLINLREPGQATLLKQIDWRPAFDLLTTGDLLLASVGDLAVADLADPESPSFATVTWQGDVECCLRRLTLDQGRLYSPRPDSAEFPIVVDVSDPLRPMKLKVGGHPPRAEVRYLAARDHLLYLIYNSGLGVFQAQDPGDLGQLSHLDFDANYLPVGLSRLGDRLLISRSAWGGAQSELLAVDVADPAAPRVLGRLTLSTRLSDVVAVGELVHVAAFDGGLQSFRLAPYQPTASPTPAPTEPAVLSLGDQVFRDLDNDAEFEPRQGEVGIGRVPLRLYRDDGSGSLDSADGAPIRSATSQPTTGRFRFNALAPGDYLLELDPLAFASGGALEGMETSFGLTGGRSADPDDNVDHDDNGNGFSSSGVSTFAITLSEGDEPVTDGDADDDSNLTLDLGFTLVNVATPTWTPTPDSSTPTPGWSPTITSGSPTASRTPTRRATSGRGPIYLPVLPRDQACPPLGRFTDVVLVVDASALMGQTWAGGASRMTAVQSAVRAFIDGTGPGVNLRLGAGRDQLAIVTHGHPSVLVAPLGSSRAALLAAVDRLPTEGSAGLPQGLELARLELISRRHKPGQLSAVIVISAGQTTPDAATMRMAGLLKGDSAIVIALVLEPLRDEKAWQRLASPNRHFGAADPGELDRALQSSAASSLCPGKLYWGNR